MSRRSGFLGKALLLAAVSFAALAAGVYWKSERDDVLVPPTMHPDGEAHNDGFVLKQKTIDYEAIIRGALAEEASFLTLTLSFDKIRDQSLETSIRFLPFTASHARVRVKYHVEYPIGYTLRPGQFRVSGGGDGIVITLHRPRLIATPSVRILSYETLERGLLVDDKTALLELQKRLEQEAEKRGEMLLGRTDVTPRSERALRGFLSSILERQTPGAKPPTITFHYP